jgi:hypothetical protein
MSSVHPKFGHDGLRPTYEVAEVILGGQLVMPDAVNPKIKVATANALILGIAVSDTAPAGTSDQATDAYGNQVINASLPSPYTAVGMDGVWMIENAGAALVLGDLVKAAALGKVTKATTPATDQIIGRVVDAGGATAAKVAVLLTIAPVGIAS